jgi:hypothetical protein
MAFDKVLTDAQWTQKRNDTGLKTGLTSKVELGKAFKAFGNNKNATEAQKLLGKIRIYHTQLQKHTREKYFPMLNLLVEQQIKALTDGIAEEAKGERKKMADEALAVLSGIKSDQDKLKKKIDYKAIHKKSADDKIRRLDALRKDVDKLSAEFKGGAPISAAAQEKVGTLKAEGDKLCQKIAQELAKEVKKVWPNAATLWKKSMSPLILAYLNRAIAKSNNVILKVTPDQLSTGALKGIHDRFVQDFPELCKSMSKDDLIYSKLEDLKYYKDFRQSYLQEATKLLKGEIAKVETAKTDSALFRYAPLNIDVKAPPQGSRNPKVSAQTLANMNRLADALEGIPVNELATQLEVKAQSLIGRSQQYYKVVKTLSGSIDRVVTNVGNALGRKTPDIDDARKQLAPLTQHVATACAALPDEAQGLKDALEQHVGDRLEKHLNKLIKAKSPTKSPT